MADASPIPEESPGSTLPVILVVDDEPALLSAVQRMLRGLFRVVLACDVEEARALSRQHRFHLVPADFAMPRETGVDLARFLRAEGVTCPVLLMTGNAEDAQVEQALQRGEVDGVLEKPWAMDSLRAEVERRVAAYLARLRG